MSLPDRLRAWRREHPKTDLALGFVPYLGTALAADDFIQDPSLLGAAGLALGPLSALRKAKKLGITTYHGSKKGPWNELRADLSRPPTHGQIEGPGLYTTENPVHAAAWASKVKIDPSRRFSDPWGDMDFVRRRGKNALKKPDTTIYEVDIPDEEFAKYLHLGDRPAVLRALEKIGIDPKGAEKYYKTRTKITRDLDLPGRVDTYQDMLPFRLPEIAGGEWGATIEALPPLLAKAGYPGLYRPRVDRILTFDPDKTVEAIRRYAP
jgi:hypothetical protein